MIALAIRIRAVALLIGLAVIQWSSSASAQFLGNGQLPNNGNNGVPIIPNQQPMVQNNLTPQQMQAMMMMRAMSGRGRRGVQTGFLQNIPLGTGSFPGAPVIAAPAENESSSTHKSSAQKRAEARKQRENQKHAVRQDEKAKKTKPAKKADADQKHAAK